MKVTILSILGVWNLGLWLVGNCLEEPQGIGTAWTYNLINEAQARRHLFFFKSSVYCKKKNESHHLRSMCKKIKGTGNKKSCRTSNNKTKQEHERKQQEPGIKQFNYENKFQVDPIKIQDLEWTLSHQVIART